MQISREIKRFAGKVKGKLTMVFAPEPFEAVAQQTDFLSRTGRARGISRVYTSRENSIANGGNTAIMPADRGSMACPARWQA
jgi:hypothetical protein